ncbi:HK97-gp10 family putative phage morphogenesis protein [Planococcus sp. SSTMD024]|uniref:HK97-gp10 family putative phage morphogenesis protein n=1 Tax=Planococcus sp. SSTMD024 TaxID=3242163 RepID=UPI00351F2BC5
MARGRVKIGNRKLQKVAAEFGDQILDEVKRIVLETAQIIQSNAKSLAPVDSSNLKDSIEMEIFEDGLKAVVRVTADYAIYVEYGTGIYAEGPGGSRAKKIPWTYWSVKLQKYVTTSGMKAQPYWNPAVDAGERYFRREMRRLG